MHSTSKVKLNPDMDSTLSCLLLPPPPPAAAALLPNRLRGNGARVLRGDDHGSWRPVRCSRALSKSVETRRRNGGGMRVKALFGDGGDPYRAVMRIVKLNSAIQNRSVRELLELIVDECQYFFSNLPPFNVAEMSKNMFLLLHEMMLRHQVSFVLKPRADQGFDLGVQWSLEWKGKKLPWDLDCSISTTHVYKGLLLISQVNKACVPLLQRILQIIHQNLDAVILTVANKLLPEGTLDGEETSKRIASAIVGLVVMALFYAMFKNS